MTTRVYPKLSPEERRRRERERARAEKLRQRQHRAWLAMMANAPAPGWTGPTLAMLDPHVEDWTKPGEQATAAELDHYGPKADALALILGRLDPPRARARRALAMARLDKAWRTWAGAHPEALLDDAHPVQAWLTHGPRVTWRHRPSAQAGPTMPRLSVPVARRSGEPPRSSQAPRPGGGRAPMPRPRHP